MSKKVILRNTSKTSADEGKSSRSRTATRGTTCPRKLALAVTDENKRQIERERAKADAREAEELKEKARRPPRRRSKAVELTVGAPRRGEQCAVRIGHVRLMSPTCLPLAVFTVDRLVYPAGRAAQGRSATTRCSVKLYRDVVAQVTVKVVLGGVASATS